MSKTLNIASLNIKYYSIKYYTLNITVAVACWCSVATVFLQISQNSQKNTCAWCFLVKFAKYLRTPYFIEHLRWLLLNLYLRYNLYLFVNLYLYIDNFVFNIFLLRISINFSRCFYFHINNSQRI